MKWLWIMCMAAVLAGAPNYVGAQQAKDTSSVTQPQAPEVKGVPAGAAKRFTPAERKAYEKKTAEELAAIQQKIADLRTKAASGAPQNKRLLNPGGEKPAITANRRHQRVDHLEKSLRIGLGPAKSQVG